MEFENYINSKFYAFFEFVSKLIVINLLWFFTSLLGLFVFTIVPATVTSYILIHAHIKGQDFPTSKSFFKVFFSIYWKSQKVALLLLLAGAILVLDIVFFYQRIIANPSMFLMVGLMTSFIIGLMYLFTLIHLGPVFLYFEDLSVLQTLKYAFLFGVGFLFRSAFILLISVATFVIVMMKPILVPLVPTILIAILIYFSLRIVSSRYERLTINRIPRSIHDYN